MSSKFKFQNAKFEFKVKVIQLKNNVQCSTLNVQSSMILFLFPGWEPVPPKGGERVKDRG
jgi:hypothetical protein